MPTKTIRVKKQPGEPGWYTEPQKLEALALYLSVGNMSIVSEKLHIPIKTLYKWKYSPWWKEQLNELQAGNRIKLSARVSNILNKASIDLEDRLENGNYWYNKEKKALERRPLTTREVVEIMKVGVVAQEMVDKAQEAYDNRDQRDKKAQEQIERLEKIAKMLSHNTPVEPPKIIDVIPMEIVNAEQPQL